MPRKIRTEKVNGLACVVMTPEETAYQWSRYQAAAGQTLYTAYKSPSDNKRRAWRELENEAKRRRARRDLRITSAGCQLFTCSYTLVDAKTGEVRLIHHTPTYRYISA